MKNLFTLLFLSISILSLGQAKLKLLREEIVNENIDYGFSRPRISLNQEGPVFTWGKRSNKEAYSSRKSNGSFSLPLQVNPQKTTIFAQDWVGPELASRGDLVVSVFELQPEGQGLVYASISQDGGQSFSDTLLVSSNPLTRFPTVAIGPKNEIYVAFMTFEKDYKDPHFSVVRYNAITSTFSKEVNGTAISPGEVCDCCPANLVVTDNEVVLLFRNNDNDIRDIWAAVSTNDGKTFDVIKPIDTSNWMIGVCPSSGPIGLAGSKSIRSTFMTGASGRSRIRVTEASTSDLSIKADVLITDQGSKTASQNYPIIDGQSNIVGVVYQEVDQGVTKIKLVVSLTGVNGLIDATPLVINTSTTSIPQNPDLVYSNGIFHITWQDLRTRKVYYRRVIVENLNAEVESYGPISPLISSYDRSLHVRIPGKEFDAYLYGVSGQLLKTFANQDGSDELTIQTNGLKTGYYILRFSFEGQSAERKIFIP